MRSLLKSPGRVSTFETAPVNLPYLGLYGVESTCTDETTSMGMLIAFSPVAGSVTSELLTRDPFSEERAPLILIRPLGPRTTPGTRGSKSSKRSSRFGMCSTVDWLIVALPED